MKTVSLFILILLLMLFSSSISAKEPAYNEHYGELGISQAPKGKILYSSEINNIGFIYVEYDDEPWYPWESVLLYLRYKNNYYKALILPQQDMQEKITFINNNLFYFQKYEGGNSINAENRKALISIDNDKVYYCGNFSKICGDGFCVWEEIIEEGDSHADFDYKEVKMNFENNILSMPKSKNP